MEPRTTPPPLPPPPPPTPSGGGGPIWTWTSAVLLFLNVAGLLLLWPLFVLMTPKFVEVIKDFDAELPWLTRQVVRLCDHSWVVGVFCLGLCGVLVAAQVLSRRKRVATWLNVAVGVLMGVFLALWMVALMTAMPALARSVAP